MMPLRHNKFKCVKIWNLSTVQAKTPQFAARISAYFSRFVYSLINRFLCLIIVPLALLQLYTYLLLNRVIAGESIYNRLGTGYLPGTEVNHDNNTGSFNKTFV